MNYDEAPFPTPNSRFRQGFDNLMAAHSRPLPSNPRAAAQHPPLRSPNRSPPRVRPLSPNQRAVAAHAINPTGRPMSPNSMREGLHWWAPSAQTSHSAAPPGGHPPHPAVPTIPPHKLAVLRAAARLMWPESRTSGSHEAARTGLLRWRGCALRDWRAILIPQLLARVQALSRSSHLGWSARLLRGCTKRAFMQWFGSAYKERYQMLFKQYSTEVGVLSSMAEGLRHHLSEFSLQHKTLSENGQGYARVLECHSIRLGHLEQEKSGIRNDCTVLVGRPHSASFCPSPTSSCWFSFSEPHCTATLCVLFYCYCGVLE